MNAERPYVSKAASLAVTLGLAVALTACGPSTPPAGAGKDAASSGAAASAPAPAVSLATLKSIETLDGTNWDLAEGVSVAQVAGEAPMDGWKPVTLTGEPTTGFHRIGLSKNFGGGTKTYQMTVWVKTSPGVDAMLEARGKTLEGGQPVDYGVAYFDLAGGALAKNRLVTDKTKLVDSAVTQDGEWRKLTGNITTRDGWVFLVVGMVSKGEHVFTGSPAQQMTVGGMEVKPL